jgi:hypothetical protein
MISSSKLCEDSDIFECSKIISCELLLFDIVGNGLAKLKKRLARRTPAAAARRMT